MSSGKDSLRRERVDIFGQLHTWCNLGLVFNGRRRAKLLCRQATRAGPYFCIYFYFISFVRVMVLGVVFDLPTPPTSFL